MTLAGTQPKLEVVRRDGSSEPYEPEQYLEEAMAAPPSVEEQLRDAVRAMRCYNCKEPTDRLIVFRTAIGIVREYECLSCRQERVQAQVDAGLRPASDLLPENLPEVRNPL